ncbi:retinol dehydrogenase 12-like [Ochlerotatus camptorhynchus]|uniref:retinol dehydrogenase 12-like n=1 Tax=Ochlerotatus camptorhynchus TaxID=644619 RepID=UPI0031E01157
MGVLQKIALLLTLGTVTFAIRWHYIGRLYRTRRNFANRELIVITGATSGIGLAVVSELVSQACHLVLGCRNQAAGLKLREDLKDQFGSDIVVDIFDLDLNCLKSVAAFVKQVNALQKPIYALVNNAGVFYAPPALTVDGLEQTFQVNFLSHYLITVLLLPRLKQFPGNSRVINVSSKAHQAVERFPDLELHRDFEDLPSNRFRAYQYSKFSLVLFAHKLSSILADSTVSIHCVDPGNVETNIYRNFPPLANKALFYLQKPLRILLIKTSREGAQGILYAILSEEVPRFYITKHYFNANESHEVNPRIYNPILGDTLWTLSRQLCRGHLLEMS